MKSNALITRIGLETNLVISDSESHHELAGLFNRFRPDGVGLDRMLRGDGIEGEVRARIMRICQATASSWDPRDIYFVIRRFEPIDQIAAGNLARIYIHGLKNLANFLGDAEVGEALGRLKVVDNAPTRVDENHDLPIIIYEFVTDFLATLQPEHHELFILKEALYSMANDYFLMAYVLWPVIGPIVKSSATLDSYFEIWRFGITLEYFANGLVVPKLP